MTVYELVGGESFFVDLVDRFYDGVAGDPILIHMYPSDLTDAKAHLAGFLVQYWGGPTTYSDERGHPRLRMRHVPFQIGQAERDAWFDHMLASLGESGAPDEVTSLMAEYFDGAATAMINHTE
jgi:hemoglobin